MAPSLSPPPNVEERLCAAAHSILTDGQRHEYRATRWAVRFLERAAPGERTAFTRAQLRRLTRTRNDFTTNPRRGRHVPS
jgi:hypothetical protein